MSERRIYGRNHLVGSGAMNHPDRLEELEELRAKHERLTRGKPKRAFGELLDEKMHGKKKDDEEEKQDEPEKGAIDPHLGLTPGQDASLASGAKGRRSGKVIVKG